MVGIGAIQFHLGLQGYAVGKSALETFVNGIAWRVDKVVEELQHEVITRIGNGEVLCKYFIQAVVLALLGRRVQLQEVSERLELHVKEIRIRHGILDACKVNSVINNF